MNTGDDWMEDGERVSALVDGQLPEGALGQTLALLQGSSRARAAWSDYHLVGEAMRAGQAQASADDAQFVARLRQRLAAPAPQTLAEACPQPVAPVAVAHAHSANDARWKRVVGLASLALVGVVAWQGVQRVPASAEGAGAQVARVATPPAGAVLVLTPPEHDPVFAATQPQMIRDARLDAVLAASRQPGANAAMQPPSVFLRNATFEQGRR